MVNYNFKFSIFQDQKPVVIQYNETNYKLSNFKETNAFFPTPGLFKFN